MVFFQSCKVFFLPWSQHWRFQPHEQVQPFAPPTQCNQIQYALFYRPVLQCEQRGSGAPLFYIGMNWNTHGQRGLSKVAIQVPMSAINPCHRVKYQFPGPASFLSLGKPGPHWENIKYLHRINFLYCNYQGCTAE